VPYLKHAGTVLQAETPVLELRGKGASEGLAPFVQALSQTLIIGLRSAFAIRPPENFLIIRPLKDAGTAALKCFCSNVAGFSILFQQ